jgi:hypothetical protein
MFALTGHTSEVETADVDPTSRRFRRSGKAPTRGMPMTAAAVPGSQIVPGSAVA